MGWRPGIYVCIFEFQHFCNPSLPLAEPKVSTRLTQQAQDWEGAWVWTLVCVKKHSHLYFLPAVTSQPVALTTRKGLSQPLLPLGRQTWVWGSDATFCFFAHGQLRPDPAHSKTRLSLFKKTHPDYTSKQMTILYFLFILENFIGHHISPLVMQNHLQPVAHDCPIFSGASRGHTMLKDD